MIEVPAGLVDAGESAAESAVRELKEETGYVGVAAEISPVMFNGMCFHHLISLVFACVLVLRCGQIRASAIRT